MSSPRELHNNTSTGQKMVESAWLDTHFQASRAEYEAMLRESGIRQGWHVLDAGAGSGSYIPLLSDMVGSHGTLTTVDLAAENVDALKKRLQESPTGCTVQIYQSDLLDMPFPNDSFDAVWCANSIQYFRFPQWSSLLAEFKRVLKPGGLVAIKEFDDIGVHFGPFDHALIWRLIERIRNSDLILGAGSPFTVNLNTALLSAGFEQVNFRTYTGDFHHPLTPVQQAFLTSALTLYYTLSQQADIPAEEKRCWQQKLGDPESEEYLLKQPDFYFREVHGLATARKGLL